MNLNKIIKVWPSLIILIMISFLIISGHIGYTLGHNDGTNEQIENRAKIALKMESMNLLKWCEAWKKDIDAATRKLQK